MGHIISAIELGSSKITTLIGQVQEDPLRDEKVNILGVGSCDSAGVRKGQIVDIEETVEVAIASLEAAERMAGVRVESALVSINGAHIASQNSHGVVAVAGTSGEISEDDVTRVIDAARAISLPTSREVIHVIPRGFLVDGETGIKDPVGMSGVRLEVETHIVTAGSGASKNIYKILEEMGVACSGIVFSGLAASDAVLTKTEKELGCVVIDVGGGTASIAIFIEGELAYSSVIPIGGKNVTNDLAIGLRVSLDSAEKIKMALLPDHGAKKAPGEREASDEMDVSELGIEEAKKVSKKTLIEGIIRPRLNEIFTMVKIELDRAGLGTKIPSGVVITGGGAETVGIVESAKRILSLPARLGVPTGITGLIDEIVSPAYAVPVGLLLYGAKSGISTPSGITLAGRRIRIPDMGLASKLFDSIKNLLP